MDGSSILPASTIFVPFLRHEGITKFKRICKKKRFFVMFPFGIIEVGKVLVTRVVIGLLISVLVVWFIL